MGPRAGMEGCENLAPTGIRSPDLPTRSESLYRLSYRGPLPNAGLYSSFWVTPRRLHFMCLSFGTFCSTIRSCKSVPKRRNIKFRRRNHPKRKNTTLTTRRKFEIKKYALRLRTSEQVPSTLPHPYFARIQLAILCPSLVFVQGRQDRKPYNEQEYARGAHVFQCVTTGKGDQDTILQTTAFLL